MAGSGARSTASRFSQFQFPAYRRCHYRWLLVSVGALSGLPNDPDAAVSSLIPALSCRSCRPNAPFCEGAETVKSRGDVMEKVRCSLTSTNQSYPNLTAHRQASRFVSRFDMIVP